MNIVVKNFLSILFGNIFSRVISFVLLIFIARNYGPNDFGIINFSNAFITYFAMLASFGLSTLGIVEVSKDKNKLRDYVNDITSIKIIMSIVSYLFLLIIVLLIHKSTQVKLMILLSGLTIVTSSFAVDWVFTATQEMKYISYSVIINSLLSAGILILFFMSGYLKNIYIVPVSSVAASLVSSIYLFRIYKKRINYKFQFHFDNHKYILYLRTALPFFFSGVFATVNCNIDTIILGFMRSDFEVGLYNVVYKLVNIFVMFTTFIFTPIYPMLINYFNNKQYLQLNTIINNTRKLIYIISLPIVLSAIFLNKEIILTLYGQEYEKASTVFIVLIIYVAILSIRELYGYELTAWGLQKKYMNIVLISSLYNIIANLLLIPVYGIEAAAINTLISELINLIFMYRLSRSTYKISYNNKHILRIVLSGLITIVVIIAFKKLTGNAFILVTIEAVIYMLMLFLTKVVTIKEIRDILTNRGAVQ